MFGKTDIVDDIPLICRPPFLVEIHSDDDEIWWIQVGHQRSLSSNEVGETPAIARKLMVIHQRRLLYVAISHSQLLARVLSA